MNHVSKYFIEFGGNGKTIGLQSESERVKAVLKLDFESFDGEGNLNSFPVGVSPLPYDMLLSSKHKESFELNFRSPATTTPMLPHYSSPRLMTSFQKDLHPQPINSTQSDSFHNAKHYRRRKITNRHAQENRIKISSAPRLHIYSLLQTPSRSKRIPKIKRRVTTKSEKVLWFKLVQMHSVFWLGHVHLFSVSFLHPPRCVPNNAVGYTHTMVQSVCVCVVAS